MKAIEKQLASIILSINYLVFFFVLFLSFGAGSYEIQTIADKSQSNVVKLSAISKIMCITIFNSNLTNQNGAKWQSRTNFFELIE